MKKHSRRLIDMEPFFAAGFFFVVGIAIAAIVDIFDLGW